MYNENYNIFVKNNLPYTKNLKFKMIDFWKIIGDLFRKILMRLECCNTGAIFKKRNEDNKL